MFIVQRHSGSHPNNHLYHFSGFGVGPDPSFGDFNHNWQPAPPSPNDNDTNCSQDNCTPASSIRQQWDYLDAQIAAIIEANRNGQISTNDAYQQLRDLVTKFDHDIIEPEINGLGTGRIEDTVDVAMLVHAIDEMVNTSFAMDVGGIGKLVGRSLEQDLTKLLTLKKNQCGTTAHTLIYSKDEGWFINLKDAEEIYKIFHILLMLEPTMTLPMGTLDNCRPAGFKFSDASLEQTTAQNGGTGDFTMHISMRTCGTDPYTNDWESDGWTNEMVVKGSGATVPITTETKGVFGKLPESGQVTVPKINLTF